MSDKEPIYQFVKGQGWVATAERSVEFTFACGTRCRMIDRMPQVGERFRSATRYGNFGSETPDLDYWSRYISDVKFTSCSVWGEHKRAGTGSLYVTVVPL